MTHDHRQAHAADRCVFDAWGADFGVVAGARCLNDDAEHQRAMHDDHRAVGAEPEDVTM